MRKSVLFLTLCVIFLIHFAVGFHLARQNAEFYYHNDGREYAQMAESFAATGRMMIDQPRYYETPRTEPIPEAYRPPLLSCLAGSLIAAGFPPAAAYALLQALLFCLASWMVVRTAETIDPAAPTAWFALLLFNIHPLIFEYSVQFCSETLFIFWILCFIRIFLTQSSWRRALLLAAAGFGMTLTRPTGLIFLPGGILLLLLLDALDSFLAAGTVRAVFRFRCFRNALLYGVCFTLLMLPFGIRNQVLFGKFSLSTFFGGYNFYVGNNRENWKAYAAGSGKEFLDHQNRGWREAIRLVNALPESYAGKPPLQDSYMMGKALEEIRAMGGWKFLGLLAAKGWQFICPWPVRRVHAPLLFWGFTLWEVFLYGCGAAGIGLCRKRWRVFVPFVFLFAGGFLAHTLTFVSMRYRIPFLDVVLIVFSAVALRALWEKSGIGGRFSAAGTRSILQKEEKGDRK